MFSNWTDEPETRRSGGDGRSGWVSLAITVATLVWLIAGLWAAFRAMLFGWDTAIAHFFGVSSGRADVHENALLTLAIATVPPAVALAIALLLRRRVAVAILGVVTALGLLGGLCFYVVVT